MSLPVLPSSTPNIDNPTNGPRPTSPESGRSTPPTRTFEESTSGEKREHSRDRVSVHGFGPGSVNERNRNKGKARVDLVIGSLYLQTGRWNDALRELAEGAKKSSLFSDHLWHAKALENVMICMILLAWSRTDFKVSPSLLRHMLNTLIAYRFLKFATLYQSDHQATKGSHQNLQYPSLRSIQLEI